MVEIAVAFLVLTIVAGVTLGLVAEAGQSDYYIPTTVSLTLSAVMFIITIMQA